MAVIIATFGLLKFISITPFKIFDLAHFRVFWGWESIWLILFHKLKEGTFFMGIKNAHTHTHNNCFIIQVISTQFSNNLSNA